MVEAFAREDEEKKKRLTQWRPPHDPPPPVLSLVVSAREGARRLAACDFFSVCGVIPGSERNDNNSDAGLSNTLGHVFLRPRPCWLLMFGPTPSDALMGNRGQTDWFLIGK